MGLNRFTIGDRVQRLPQHSGLIALLPTTIGLVSLASLLLLVQTSLVTSTGYDIERLQEIRDDWKQKNYQLGYEIDSLKALPRIEQEAINRLGMVPATQHVYVKVDVPSQARLTPEIHLPTQEEPASVHTAPGWWEKLMRFLTLWKDTARNTS